MQGAGTRTGPRGGQIGLVAVVVVGVVAAALPGCHAGAAPDTTGGSSRGAGAAASQDAGHAPTTQAEIAAQVNAQGEALMRAGNYNVASMKFEEAAGRSPEVKYLINYCIAVFRGNRLELAYRVCKGARTPEATPAQLAEIDALLKQVVQAGKQQGIELCDACGYEAPLEPPPPPR